jgi:hypothetical protein
VKNSAQVALSSWSIGPASRLPVLASKTRKWPSVDLVATRWPSGAELDLMNFVRDLEFANNVTTSGVPNPNALHGPYGHASSI